MRRSINGNSTNVYMCLAAVAALGLMSGGASAQTVQNGNFEGGFTSGSYGSVGNQWTSWRSSTYNGTFSDGTDQIHGGAHTQKYNMPQPGAGQSNEELGIYQLVNTSLGGVYTFTLWLRSFQNGETYQGEDLNIEMGLDPYGGTYLYSLDIQWHALSNNRNVWESQIFPVTAQGPLTTIFIRAIRKWPQHGSAAVWVDDVTVSGPPPQATYTPVPTITPSPTIPAPVGPEKIVNGGFDTFTGSLANNWSSWSTQGAGYWKQSTRIGKAGSGNYWSVNGWYQDAVAMNPKVTLLGTGFGASDSFATEPNMVDTIVLGRQNFDDYYNDIYFGDFQGRALWLADIYTVEAGYHPRVDAWLGMNEPDWGTASNWARAIAFETYFTQLMHQRGLKTCVLNLAVGNPGDLNRILDCKALFEIADFLGYHSYGGPNDELMVNNINQDDPYSYALRARVMHDMYALRGWKWPATIYTEGTTYGGWHGSIPNGDIRDDIIAMRGYMDQDRWNVGLTIFTCGSNGVWEGWDITGRGIAGPVGVANADNPADRTSGLYSQQWGVGTIHCLNNVCNHNGVFTGGVVQAVSGMTSGQTYRLGFDFKWEHANGTAALTFQYGLDWTGQTSNGNAGTINWSSDLITLYNLPHEIFQYHYALFTAQSNTVSVWFRSSQNLPSVSYRLNLDSVSLQQVSGTPPPTTTPGGAATPTLTPTPTRTATPTIACNPSSVDVQFNNASTFDSTWTAYGNSPQRFIKSEFWCSHTAQELEIQSTDGGYYRIFPEGDPGGTYTLTMDYVRGNGTRYIRVDANGGTNPAVYTQSWTNSGGTWVCENPSALTGTVGASGNITVFLGTTTNGQYEHLHIDFTCPPPPPTSTPAPATSTPTRTPTLISTHTRTPSPSATRTPTGTPTRTPTTGPTSTPYPTQSGMQHEEWGRYR